MSFKLSTCVWGLFRLLSVVSCCFMFSGVLHHWDVSDSLLCLVRFSLILSCHFFDGFVCRLLRLVKVVQVVHVGVGSFWLFMM